MREIRYVNWCLERNEMLTQEDIDWAKDIVKRLEKRLGGPKQALVVKYRNSKDINELYDKLAIIEATATREQ